MKRSPVSAAASMILFCAALALGACERQEPGPPAPVAPVTPDTATAEPVTAAKAAPDLAALHADVPGIAWFDGSVEAALDASRAANKPLMLFWGAQWCPSCKQLKASVFTRPDFVEKSKLFVPVYLDGDLPDAQKWGDTFEITGYPTLLILKPDRTEVTRLAGGMDLTLYAQVLDSALGDVRPVREIVDLAADGKELLAADDCRRLAYHAFGLEDDAVFAASRLASAFEGAAARCPANLVRERARFTILAAGAVGTMESAAAAGGNPHAVAAAATPAPSVRYQQLIGAVHALLTDRETALANLDALAGLGSGFFAAARVATPELTRTLGDRWTALADAAAIDPRYSPGDQLNAERMKVAAARGLSADGTVPTAIAGAALKRSDEMLASEHTPYDRAGIIVTALDLYLDLNDQTRMRALLEQEVATSKTPYYYLAHLAEVEELAGNKARAVELLAQAYDGARGPASRFQWGYNYVNGLLRMQPENAAVIERAGLKVFGELAGADSIHRRTRIRLEKLEAALGRWNTTPERAAVVAKLNETLVATKSRGAS
ncbi:MAG: thioredoxin family protein [Gammaproteobacteria bacterium]